MPHLRSSLGLAALVATSLSSIFVYRLSSAPNVETARDLAVTCGSEHRAVVRHAAGQSSVAVDCVPFAATLPAAVPFVAEREMTALAAVPQPAPRMIPAVYTLPSEAASVQPAPIVRRTSASSNVARKVDRKPSWQKRALTIGGAAGAGVGIGALVGGKKGALVGAAVGGGGATAVDLLRNR